MGQGFSGHEAALAAVCACAPAGGTSSGHTCVILSFDNAMNVEAHVGSLLKGLGA